MDKYHKLYKLQKYRFKLYNSNTDDKIKLYEKKFLEYQKGGVICDIIGPQIRKPDSFNNIRFINELNVIHHEKKIRNIRSAEMLLIDYQQLKNDFVYFKTMKDEEIDSYILSRCAIISVKNYEARMNLYANMDNQYNIFSGPDKFKNVKYYRPANYGRSLVMTETIGDETIQLDIKGVGTGKYYKILDDGTFQIVDYAPIVASHRTGVFPLGEAIEEYFNEHIFRHIISNDAYLTALKIDSLRSYAVIKLNIRLNDDKYTELAVYVRQATNRKIDLFNEQNKLMLSTVLSWYGMGSHYSYGHYLNIIKYLNLQGTEDYNEDEMINNTINKYVYVIDFSGYYYYCSDFFKNSLILRSNVRKHLYDNVSNKLFANLGSEINLVSLRKNYPVMKVIAKLFGNDNLDDKNKWALNDTIKLYVHQYIFSENSTIVRRIIDNVVEELVNLSNHFWFKCSITDCPSMKQFCEKGNYDVEIRTKLLETYGKNISDGKKLNILICNIANEFNEKKKSCENLTFTSISSFIEKTRQSDSNIQLIIDNNIDELLNEIKQNTYSKYSP